MYQNKANTKETITYLTPQKKKKKSTHLQLYWQNRNVSYFIPKVKFIPKYFMVIWMLYKWYLGFPGGSDGKESTCNVRDLGLIPGSGRFPGEGHDNPLQFSFSFLN